jgi:hypothetical protein
VSGAPAGGPGDGDLGLFVLLGTLGIGAVALAGSGWVVVAGRRDRRLAVAPMGTKPSDPGVIAAAIVERRAMRRARLRSSDDPILAAMGLPDEDAMPGAKPGTTPAPRRRSPRSGGSNRPPARPSAR